MAEEQRWQEPGSLSLCANNCGFFGSPATLNLCSKCYKDKCMKEGHLAMGPTLLRPKPPPSVSTPMESPSEPLTTSGPAPPAALRVTESSSAAAWPNRCEACKKRVGLVGFTCKCGATFCGSHRYPEEHGCGFNYKAMGREAIAMANPVIKGKKLDKI